MSESKYDNEKNDRKMLKSDKSLNSFGDNRIMRNDDDFKTARNLFDIEAQKNNFEVHIEPKGH